MKPKVDSSSPRSDTFYLLLVSFSAVAGLAAFAGALIQVDSSDEPLTADQSIVAQCEYNLKRIGAAIRQYHDEHGSFPPPYVEDQDGVKMHSWRVLLLPYVGQQELYDQYNFDQAWDGPDNIQLAARLPEVYRCPGLADGSGETTTCYVAVVGEKTVWRPGRKTSLDQIKDDPAHTVLLVEAVNAQVPWLSPEDFQFARMGVTFGAEADQQPSSAHPPATHLLMVDGSVQVMTDHQTKGVFRGLLEISDGSHPRAAEGGDTGGETGGAESGDGEDGDATGPDVSATGEASLKPSGSTEVEDPETPGGSASP